MEIRIDSRIRKRIEVSAGFSLETFPDEGISVRISDARTDKPKNRLLVLRVAGHNGALVTGIPRIVKAISDCARSMTVWDLFSPLGLAEIKRSLSPSDAESLDEAYGQQYFLTSEEEFRPVVSQHNVVVLRKKDLPPEQYDMRMGERRSSETGDFIWAFACYHNEPNISATELTPFGPQCASISVVFWENDEIAGFGVGTEEPLRGQGYALAVVSAATQWVLKQDAVAWYGAYSDNIPSLRIARRLGFSLVYQSFGA